MYRTALGEARPKNFDELIEAIDEMAIDPTNAWVDLDFQEPGEGLAMFDGWTAEIHGTNEDNEDVELGTAGYADKEELIKDLVAARIPRRDIREA